MFPGNFFGSCIIKISNLMKHVIRKKTKLLILLIYFRKAFDSPSHKYINECLELLNFGPSIWKWVSPFYCNREAYILPGEEPTKKILLEQGVPKVIVVLPYVFILAVELLLLKIINTKLTESRSETFLEDTSICIKRGPKYFRKCIEYTDWSLDKP